MKLFTSAPEGHAFQAVRGSHEATLGAPNPVALICSGSCVAVNTHSAAAAAHAGARHRAADPEGTCGGARWNDWLLWLTGIAGTRH